MAEMLPYWVGWSSEGDQQRVYHLIGQGVYRMRFVARKSVRAVSGEQE